MSYKQKAKLEKGNHLYAIKYEFSRTKSKECVQDLLGENHNP